MRTSFFFVMWIIVYPILDIVGIDGIEKYAFVIALMLIGGLSMVLRRLFPALIEYDSITEKIPILEEVYNEDTTAFRKRLKRNFGIEAITSSYFIFTILLSLFIMLELHLPMVIEVAVFGILAYGSIAHALSLRRALRSVNDNPSPQNCMWIVDDVYRTNYIGYYNMRKIHSYEELIADRPRHYGAYRIVSIVFAVIAAILGCATIALGLLSLTQTAIVLAAPMAIVMLLYGSLALIYGLKDAVALTSLKRPSA